LLQFQLALGLTQALPERERVVLLGAGVEGLTYGEIARSLDCSERTVARLYASAKSSLKRALKRDWGE